MDWRTFAECARLSKGREVERALGGIEDVGLAFEPLPRSFFEPSARAVAPALLGHWLVRRTEAGFCGGAIVEAEAYLHDDPACHAFRGPTERNRSMFGAPGHAYVYFIYGCHFCVNAVCHREGVGEAILIRAIEPEFGREQMRRMRKPRSERELTNGPAKLCQALSIDRRLDGVDFCDAKGDLFIARNPEVERFRIERGRVIAARRIGISKAVRLPLRFYLKKSLFVS
jgi:DNA-3-methyladenine glycosylase